MRALPWLIVGWILLGGRKPAAASQSSTSTPSPSAAPPRVAYLYQLPGDGYETVRVAVSNGQPVEAAIDQAHPLEMGIFSNEANALALVHSKGWALAWPGVKQLPDRP